MKSRKVYEGSRRKLVLAFDVGTTFSGISYSILEPGQVPTIKSVTRFPGQDISDGASKIPTIIYYDKSGRVRAVGAEAIRDGIDIEALDKGWIKAEWFKLRLQRTTAGARIRPVDSIAVPGASKIDIPALPPGKSAVDVLADFYRYLRACAKAFITHTNFNGAAIWDNVIGNISYVLAHPNGWSGYEQELMRKAAVTAGLISSASQDRSRLAFVTEGEASLHFYVHAGLLKEVDKLPGFIIVDAGGGTIDISAYRQDPTEDKKVFEEIAPAQCLVEGAVHVNLYAKRYLSGLLQGSKYGDEADIDHIVSVFEKSVKVRFTDENDPQYIKFGSTRDQDLSCGIKYGQLRIEGSDVAAFFRPALASIVQAVAKQKNQAVSDISHVIFVGGFSANTWLFNNVSKALLGNSTMQTIRPEHTSKAVVEGAMSFFLDHFVCTRVSKVYYGVEVKKLYDHNDVEHRRRARDIFRHVDGKDYISNGFTVILPKVVRGDNLPSFPVRLLRNLRRLKTIARLHYLPTGLDCNPKWLDVDQLNYVHLCSIEANLPPSVVVTKRNRQGGRYYEASFDIVLSFGLTEIQAHIAWKDARGIESRGEANIVYDSSIKELLSSQRLSRRLSTMTL